MSAILCVVALAAPFAQGLPEPPLAKIPVLVVSGANNHDWEWTSVSLGEILRESGRFDVTVTRDAPAALASERALSEFEALVLDYNGRRWGEPAESNFLEAVRGGLGVVVVHAANNAFPGWIEYEKLVALCWREGTGHGAFHPFDVRMVDRDHPITRDLPDFVQHPDELYHRLVPMHGAKYRVLALAHSSTESGGTGAEEPMALVTSYGEGRVFHTPLGHVWKDADATRASHADPQFRTLLVRGTEWAATGDVKDGRAPANHLEPWDEQAGWKLLFDGASTAGWARRGGGAPDEAGFVIANGALRHLAGAASEIETLERFSDFELELEWKVAAGAGGGLGYRGGAAEYRMQDDRAAVAADARRSAGALTGVAAPEGLAGSEKPGGKGLAPLGMWNQGRVVARGGVLEHWLNGRRVLRVDASSLEGAARLAEGTSGPIALRSEGGEIWFRSIKLRELSQAAEPLFDGRSLAGWHIAGDARFRVFEEGATSVLQGEAKSGAQGFLVSDRTFADFALELEVRVDQAGNAGVQVRSHAGDDGHLYGYQLEVDPSERGASGALYDERRRGWLQVPERGPHEPQGRAAFQRDGWNHYRIECVGPSIRCWVNGYPTADLVDRADAAGHVALEVRGVNGPGGDAKVSWRSVTLRAL